MASKGRVSAWERAFFQARVKQKNLEDKNTREAIFDFIENHPGEVDGALSDVEKEAKYGQDDQVLPSASKSKKAKDREVQNRKERVQSDFQTGCQEQDTFQETSEEPGSALETPEKPGSTPETPPRPSSNRRFLFHSVFPKNA